MTSAVLSAEDCACSECQGLGPDEDSKIARRYKRPDPARGCVMSSARQVSYITALAKKLTRGEASDLIQELKQQTAGRRGER